MNYRWILMLMLTVLASQSSVYAQSSPSFTELTVFSGGTVNPSGHPIVGFGFGMGSGKNFVGLELSHVSLASYGLGIGLPAVACASGCTNSDGTVTPAFPLQVSDSAVVNVTGNYSRDIYHGPKVMIYGTAGGGFASQRKSVISLCPTCSGTYQTFSNAGDATLAIGGGIRIPLVRGLGIRVEAKEWFYKLDQVVPEANRLTNVTVGIYYRWFNHL